MTHYRTEIEYLEDADGPTECDSASSEHPHHADYTLQAFTHDGTHIGDAWVCHQHIDDGMDDLAQKAKAYA